MQYAVVVNMRLDQAEQVVVGLDLDAVSLLGRDLDLKDAANIDRVKIIHLANVRHDIARPMDRAEVYRKIEHPADREHIRDDQTDHESNGKNSNTNFFHGTSEKREELAYERGKKTWEA